MKNTNLPKWLMPSLLALSLAACGGSGDDNASTGADNPPPTSGTPTDPDDSGTGDDNEGVGFDGLSFNVAGSTALQALSEGVAQDDSSAVSSVDGARTLFGYREVGAFDVSLMSENESAVANLLAIDEEGNTVLAVDSEWPMKVAYSVTAPDGDYVYIALENDWSGDVDYSEALANYNCGIFKVSLEDNSYSCLAEGLQVQKMDESYRKAISNNNKPLVIDDSGNIYFAAITFERNCHNEGSESEYCYLTYQDWIPQIYMVEPNEEIRELTNDLQYIESFQVLGDGRIVYFGYNEGRQRQELNIFNDPGTALLSENWGVEFFTVDDDQTVIFGDWNANGIRFASPREEGGIYRTTLDTRLFGSDENSSSRPLRVLTGDDGRMYGVFQGSREVPSEDAEGSSTWITTLSVFQVLPYDPTPKAVIDLDQDMYWWDWMARTPIQINKGHIYYTEREQVPFHGGIDAIRMVNLESGETTSLLNDNTDEYRLLMHNWRLSGDTLYFSAQNNVTTTTVMGEIDTLAVRNNDEEFLDIREVASARGAAVEVQDIEILMPRKPQTDTGSNPEARFFVAEENRYSMSIDFTKYMNRDSVVDNLSFAETSGVEVDVLPVWFYQSLHLIPDTSSQGLADAVLGPLKADTTYELELGTGTRDAWDWDLTGERRVEFTTLPIDGWIVRDHRGDREVAGVAEGAYAMYLGYLRDDSDYQFERKRMEFLHHDAVASVEVPANFSLEFSSRQVDWGELRLVVRRDGDSDEMIISLNDYRLSFQTKNINDWYEYSYVDVRNLYNSDWRRYRLTLIDGTLQFYVSTDGVEFNEYVLETWQNGDYAATGVENVLAFDPAATYTLQLNQERRAALDNLELKELDELGNLVQPVFVEDFNTLSSQQLRNMMKEVTGL